MLLRCVFILLLAACDNASSKPRDCVGRFEVGSIVYYWDSSTPAVVIARNCRELTYKIKHDTVEIDAGEEDLSSEAPEEVIQEPEQPIVVPEGEGVVSWPWPPVQRYETTTVEDLLLAGQQLAAKAARGG